MKLENIFNEVEKNKRKRKVHLSVTIPSDMKDKLDEIAKNNEVSTSGLLKAIIEEFINNF